MKEETLYTVKEVAQIVKRSPEWVHNIIKNRSIAPTKIVKTLRGRPMFLFSMEQIFDFSKNLKTNPYFSLSSLIPSSINTSSNKAVLEIGGLAGCVQTNAVETPIILDEKYTEQITQLQKEVERLNLELIENRKRNKLREELLQLFFRNQVYCSISMLEELVYLIENYNSDNL